MHLNMRNIHGNDKGLSMIMKRQEVVKFVGLCYTSIYNLEKAGKFPARRQLVAGRVGWIRSEVEAWVNGLSAVPAQAI